MVPPKRPKLDTGEVNGKWNVCALTNLPPDDKLPASNFDTKVGKTEDHALLPPHVLNALRPA